jgi:hypothetical protein
MNEDYRLEYMQFEMMNCIVGFEAIEDIQFSYPLPY